MERGTSIRLTLLVDASTEAVWRTLVEPHLTRLYRAGQQASTTWERNSPLLWVEHVEGQQHLRAKGTVLAYQPGQRLRYTQYEPASGLPDEPASYTTVDLALTAERDGRTRVDLWQGDFAGLPHDVRRTREASKQWVEALVGLKRTAEEQQGQMAA
ncbi:MAG: SRPBCC domain-containing protein [Flavobacteriales bacterium]|jgi:uncharacterized protein YndB with AHSA1/START domain|nr:SRPBCC domain-containing protein [Flavobacteriales bacterium]MBK9513378.1 SRPBCC domain-containing protein [Flavobacteriales bacterium]HOZ40337.1 SRPBCC domain-containing protein [Flavobacteriales bacterium]